MNTQLRSTTALLMEGLLHSIAAHKLSLDALTRILDLEQHLPHMTQPSPERIAALEAATETRGLLTPFVTRLQALYQRAQGEAAAPGPTVVVDVTGGLVQGVSADTACKLIVLDYDKDGDASEVTDVPQTDGSVSRAAVVVHDAHVDPAWVASIALLDQ